MIFGIPIPSDAYLLAVKSYVRPSHTKGLRFTCPGKREKPEVIAELHSVLRLLQSCGANLLDFFK